VSDHIDAITHRCWAMAERVGIQIAELPVKMRETAFAGAERCLRAAGCELGVAGQQLDRIVDLQMKAIRQSSLTLTSAEFPRAEEHNQSR
jgi:hypothetical protein